MLEVAGYAEQPPLEDGVMLDFIPALVVLLVKAEKDEGAPLTEAEVLAIRDDATCMQVPTSMAGKLADKRGYDDLDPEDVWEQWQVARTELI